MSSQRVVVDSSGWIEVFTNGRPAETFLALMADERSLVVPAAAQLSHALRQPMADSIILATARDHQARLHTMDSDFRFIPPQRSSGAGGVAASASSRHSATT